MEKTHYISFLAGAALASTFLLFKSSFSKKKEENKKQIV